MPTNKQPIFTGAVNVGLVDIPTTNANPKSDGSSSGVAPDLMYKLFTPGANGSFLDRVRFFSVASTANTTGVATVLRVFISTVANPGATTDADTWLLGEVSVPAIASANSVNATNYYDVIIGHPIPTGYYVHVSQHVAQTTNQHWQAMAIGGDY